MRGRASPSRSERGTTVDEFGLTRYAEVWADARQYFSNDTFEQLFTL